MTSEPLSAEEARVAGSLIEKQLTTPQYYPLTLNALVNACNQANNRDPVVTYDNGVVERALGALREKGYARLVHPGAGSRVTKFRHVVDEALGVDRRELALLCVLLLRGPQTLNELRTRTERMADFDDAGAVEHDLDRLADREPPLVERLGRQPGQREERFATTLAPYSTVAVASSGGPKPARHEMVSSPPTTQLGLRHRELAVLRIALAADLSREWDDHVEIARRAGVDEAEIEAVAQAGHDGWAATDALVLQTCDEVATTGEISPGVWAGLRAAIGDAAATELVFVLAHYRAVASAAASAPAPAE